MFRIGDFSKLGQVSTRMLRHYDKLGLLSPEHVDEWTGYRYYTIEQLSRLHRLIALKDMGLKLEQIGELLNDQAAVAPDRLRGMLALRRAEIRAELAEKQLQLQMVEARLQQIEQEDEPLPYEVVVKPLAAQGIASLRTFVPYVSEMGYTCETMYRQLYRRLGELKISPAAPEITLYHTDEYREEDLDVEIGVAVADVVLERPPAADDVVVRQLPAVEMAAALIYEGRFAEMTTAVLALLRHVGLHGHVPAGPLRELHLSGPAHPEGEAPPDQVVVELQLPIAPL